MIFIFSVFIAVLCAATKERDKYADNSGEQTFVTMRCPNCGATITLPSGASSWDCPWCGDCGSCR